MSRDRVLYMTTVSHDETLYPQVDVLEMISLVYSVSVLFECISIR